MPYGRPQTPESLAGVQWNLAIASVILEQWQALKFFPTLSKWIAVSTFDGVNSPIMESADGKSWALVAGPVANSLARDLDHSPTLAQIIAASASNGIQFVTSTDGGASWVGSAPSAVAAAGFNSILWIDDLGLWVAGQTAGNVATGSVATSPDGVNWTDRLTPGTQTHNPRAMAFAGQIPLIVLANSDNTTVVSADGINWIAGGSITAGFTMTGVVWAPELNGGAGFFVATSQVAGGGSSPHAFTSPDGVNWTQRVMPASRAWTGIAWNPAAGRLVAVNNNASIGTGGARFASSEDGINWRDEWGPTFDYIAIGASSEQDLFAAIANPTGVNQSIAFSE